jgi:hypothetical protein
MLALEISLALLGILVLICRVSGRIGSRTWRLQRLRSAVDQLNVLAFSLCSLSYCFM